MSLVLQLFTIFVIATASAQFSKSKAAKKYNIDDVQTPPSLLTILQSPDVSNGASSLPVNLELPREEPAEIPFYTPEPGTLAILKAPLPYYPSPSAEYNSDYPVPSQELQAPAAEPWNPDNDPKFYYELPPIVSKQEIPTNLYPKKYNKDVYEKQKPLYGRPKQEINLIPISEKDYANKQKNINKVLLNLAKVQNQKLVESEKTQQTVQV
ncbi:hypothetical protein ILUMI_00255 [Ignelater luminosus]|uniref:Uncharacterized protein n=1 Tax=Ignelater luminosus TaxID=2038154 RepID=A0A8K0GNA2_IGNLU|nr:hypothetical protein ILUMI_00255 [Ignelater luminosus]